MRFLTEVPDTLAAAELVDRLQQASLFAIYVEQRNDPESGRMFGAYVYLSDDCDMARAAAVLQEFREDGLVSRGPKCDGCSYDLRGHSGEGNCPECGRRFQRHVNTQTVAGEKEIRPCPSCGEDVPGNFECCWNCGESIN